MEYQEFLNMKAHRGAVMVISEVKALLEKNNIPEETYYENGYRVNILIALGELIKGPGRESQNRITDISISKDFKVIDQKRFTFTKNTL